jgi:hypothetical protein
MRGRALCSVVGIVSCLFVPRQAPAHHSFTAEFNPNKVLMINGTISDVSWTNPHVAIKVAVKDPAGHAEVWTVRGDSPAVLARNGWNSRMFVVGQPLTVCGYAAQSGKQEMSGEEIALAGGARMVFATTGARTCFQTPSSSATRPKTPSPSSGLITNPVGRMGNPIPPMGNPIGPAGNPVGPVIGPVQR